MKWKQKLNDTQNRQRKEQSKANFVKLSVFSGIPDWYIYLYISQNVEKTKYCSIYIVESVQCIFRTLFHLFHKPRTRQHNSIRTHSYSHTLQSPHTKTHSSAYLHTHMIHKTHFSIRSITVKQIIIIHRFNFLLFFDLSLFKLKQNKTKKLIHLFFFSKCVRVKPNQQRIGRV